MVLTDKKWNNEWIQAGLKIKNKVLLRDWHTLILIVPYPPDTEREAAANGDVKLA